MPTFKNIRIRMASGKSRLQRVQVLKSGKFRFVKNTKRKSSRKRSPTKRRSTRVRPRSKTRRKSVRKRSPRARKTKRRRTSRSGLLKF